MSLSRALVVAGALLAGAVPACKSGRLSPDEPDAGTVAVTTVGRADTLEIGAWNLKNFPCGNESASPACRASADQTPALLAQLMGALDVDLFAVEEVDDTAALQATVDALPGHASVVSSHTYGDGTYQKVGFVYDASVLAAGAGALDFELDADFPRPALEVPFTWSGPGSALSFTAIAVHLKAGETVDDEARRVGSIAALESRVRALVDGGTENVVVLGDFNEPLDGPGAQAFAPFADARYAIRTRAIVSAGATSFIGGAAVIDHVITTAALDAAVGASDAILPRLDVELEGYRDNMSDHLPVVLPVLHP